jgi:hypothetical protein
MSAGQNQFTPENVQTAVCLRPVNIITVADKA